MKKIRKGAFETNSSSSHALIFAPECGCDARRYLEGLDEAIQDGVLHLRRICDLTDKYGQKINPASFDCDTFLAKAAYLVEYAYWMFCSLDYSKRQNINASFSESVVYAPYHGLILDVLGDIYPAKKVNRLDISRLKLPEDPTGVNPDDVLEFTYHMGSDPYDLFIRHSPREFLEGPPGVVMAVDRAGDDGVDWVQE